MTSGIEIAVCEGCQKESTSRCFRPSSVDQSAILAEGSVGMPHLGETDAAWKNGCKFSARFTGRNWAGNGKPGN